MNSKTLVLTLLTTAALASAHGGLVGTAFSYQGRLNSGASPANGQYDLRFTLYDAAANGGAVAGPVTNAAVLVSNGLFQVTLDLGTVFDGSNRWLEVEARTNGAAAFTLLSPRQAVTATPYAIFAPNAGAATLASGVSTGAITSAMLADGAVTTAKLGTAAVRSANIDDGGSAAYTQLMGMAQNLSAAEPLPFSELSVVPTNGAAPTLAFRLDGAGFGKVMGFSGREAMSELYEYVVEVAVPHPEAAPEALIGHPAALYLARGARTTTFGGLITGCSVAADSGAGALYTFRLEPALAFLRFSTSYRLYQEKSVPEVVRGLYSDTTSNDLALALSGSYPKRTTTTQFAERDLSFFHRLLEGEGIFYFFQQNDTPPMLVLGDAVAAYGAPTYEGLRYYGNSPTNPQPGEECLREFYKATRESIKTATLKGYDFTSPRKGLVSQKSTPSFGSGDAYEFDAVATVKADEDRLNSVRVDRQIVERYSVTGAGNAADLRPGYTFSIDDRTETGVSGSYLVTAVRHGAFRRVTNGVASLYYGNQFEASPASGDFRPARQTPKPVAQASTGLVTGPAGQEIYADQYGRVKVQFRWDRSGTNDESSSGWVRVASQWAGQGWGSYFVPRVGQEVLVEFVGGDPDQPVITGSFYNGDNQPPYSLPVAATRSGIKTHSTPGGLVDNANEIRFDDRKGSEELFIKAEKDFNTVVNNNLNLDVGRDMTLSVGEDLTVVADGAIFIHSATDPVLTVTGTVLADTFQGSGANLNNLTAASLTGTINDARLSLNIPRLASAQSFSGSNTFLGPVGVGGPSGSDALNIMGNARLNDHDLWLRDGSDRNHGLGWYGAGKLFAGVNLDGPALYGCDGGGLGTACGSEVLALRWRGDGDVMIDPNSLNAGTLVPGLTFGNASGEGISSKRTAGGNAFGLDFYTSNQVRLAISQGGNVGINRVNPAVALEVGGAVRVTGAIRSGTETGTTQPPSYPAGSDGLVIRRARSTSQFVGNIVARTDKLTLERDGSISGLRLSYPASPGRQVINCVGLGTNGTQVVYRSTLANPATAGTVGLFSDAQKIVHYDISFGDTYSTTPGHITHVVLDRYDDPSTSDNYLVGTITSTYNQ